MVCVGAGTILGAVGTQFVQLALTPGPCVFGLLQPVQFRLFLWPRPQQAYTSGVPFERIIWFLIGRFVA